jgi:hypothetical protein
MPSRQGSQIAELPAFAKGIGLVVIEDNGMPLLNRRATIGSMTENVFPDPALPITTALRFASGTYTVGGSPSPASSTWPANPDVASEAATHTRG